MSTSTNLLEPTEADWHAVPAQAIALFLKAAADAPFSPNTRHAAELLQLLPSTTGIPNAPGPLSSMLAGGLMGAGAGYGAGWLGEHILPESWQRGRLRRTGAILGGMTGMAPGALWAQAAMRSDPDEPQLPANLKQAFFEGTGIGGDLPLINSDEFNQTIWTDPRVSRYIPIQTRAAASGLLAGAAHLAGDGGTSSMVNPYDIARMAAGMGSGYMSGMAVGKTLGYLTGMPQQTQDLLKNTGMYAGIVRTVIPRAFGN